MAPIRLSSPAAIPYCCRREMIPVGSGYAACFRIQTWRCPICEGHETTRVRVDGQSFWVGAMGRKIVAEELRILAALYPPA